MPEEVLFALKPYSFEDLERGNSHAGLAIAFTGTRDECEEHAKGLGYEWKPSPKHWVGGFWFRSAATTLDRKPHVMFMEKLVG